MLKVLLIAAYVALLNGCFFLPPSPYNRVSITGILPPSYISQLVGQSVEEPVHENIPGAIDIIGTSSELDGEVLTATFHLREVPKARELKQEVGHWQDIAYQYAVHVNLEGDPSTQLNHPDFRMLAYYYVPKARGVYVFQQPPAPWILTDQGKCSTSFFEDGQGDTSCGFVEGGFEVTFSQEDGTMSFTALVPGITDTSTIAFYAHDWTDLDYAPRGAD